MYNMILLFNDTTHMHIGTWKKVYKNSNCDTDRFALNPFQKVSISDFTTKKILRIQPEILNEKTKISSI